MSSAGGTDFASLLSSLPVSTLDATLARCVPQLDFDAGAPPDYLFISGRRNRLNPEGVSCLYFAEEGDVAMAEYRASWPDARTAKQPMVLYNIAARIQGLLDLRDPEVTKALHISDDDLFGPWRFAPAPTPMQRLGAAVARQKRVGALRHPSRALHDLGREGCNFAVFPSAMRAGDGLDVLGPAGTILRTLHIHDAGPWPVPCRIVHSHDGE